MEVSRSFQSTWENGNSMLIDVLVMIYNCGDDDVHKDTFDK